MGQKLQKRVRTTSTTTYTDYQGGFHYENYDLKFFATAEGYVNVTTRGYNYVYNYTDHLGNVRLSYMNDRLLGLLILDENHYYPFGLKHKGYEPPPTYETKYKYKFNGMELQDELGLNVYDFGARNYMPDLGRWANIDPLAENSRRWTPYNYAYNNPVYFIDPDGMEAMDFNSSDFDGLDDVIITGTMKKEAFGQLQKSVEGELNLSMNDEGKVTYTQNGEGKLSKNAQQLADAINDSSIVVNIKAENTGLTDSGDLYVGGAFSGNTVTKSESGNTVVANQEVNPIVLGKMSDAHNKPGADMW